MSDHTHRGARPPGPFIPTPDRRILELDEAVRGIEALSGVIPALGFARDSTRAAQSRLTALSTAGNITRGMVVHALPYLNWYKVQCGDGGGWVSACMISTGTMMPLGSRDIVMANPNDDVLLLRPRGLNYAYILGIIPPVISSGVVSCPDWVVQGGNTGLKREEGHKYPLKNMYRGGGIIDWSNQRPQDQTPLERGWTTSSGLAITIDEGLIQVRVNEMAGLWMTLFDGWVRLAGQQLLLESPAHEEDAGEDEGESRYFKGVATYPHESVGQYEANQGFTEENDDKEVQYSSPRAKVDLKKGQEDTQPLYRYQEFGGYLGQGHYRTVLTPNAATGHRGLDAATKDYGLFMESIGLDGAYSIVSAKSIHIGKRVKIPVPRPINLPAAASGDDAARGGYKFSSLYGDGPDHKISNVKITGTPQSMLRVAAVSDLIAYDLNWKALHPFHYHNGDYSVPQEKEMSVFSGNTEAISYNPDDFFVADPIAKQLTIDHRYGEVDYFERESFIRFHDDGTVHFGGGAGEELILGGGRMRLNAPLGIDLCPGGDLAILAGQVVVRAKGSIDFSSSEKDVRFKAENNMQFLAGNSGEGGMLFESRGKGASQSYENKFGEDVQSNGIIFRASNSVVALLGQDIYLRTGGKNLGEGDILLDASQGKRRVQVYGKEFNTFTQSAVTFNFGPLESNSNVTHTYYFGKTNMVADVELLLGGKLIGYTGGGGQSGVVVDGGVYATESIACAGVMADKKGMFLGKVPDGFKDTILTATNAAATAESVLIQDETEVHKTTIVDKYYQTGEIGDDTLIGLLEFSFRDPPGTPVQYKTSQFKWPESRWQQLVRFGLGSGGTTWTENPVIYQGQPTYPWPGKQKLVDEPTFLRLSASTLFDPATGNDNDRPYEDPQIGTFEPTTLDGQYTMNR